MITIKIKSINETDKFCTEHIGPRHWWFHHSVGGEGWVIDVLNMTLSIKDEKKSLFAILKLSDK